MSISNVLALLGGVSMFLFGMTLMGDGLKKVAGSKMEIVLYRLSGTPLKGLLLGTGVTAVIQSSSATSVMVVGFVNSGVMSLTQAAAVIQGALVGTSITGWIICLSYINGSGWVSLLSTSTITALFAVTGIVLRMFCKGQREKHVGDILLGFSVLMFGMQSMSGAVSPLRESPVFLNVLTTFSNPIVGILVGAAFTAVLQSASAAVGILQALSATGAVTFAVAYPIILGIAMGAAVPVLLSAIGAKADGRRTAFLYLIIEVIAAALFAVLYYGLGTALDLRVDGMVLNPFSIATVNTLFRGLSAVLLVPFDKQLINLSRRLISATESEKSVSELFARLDERFLIHPALAVEQSRMTVRDMAAAAVSNFMDAVRLLDSYSDDAYNRIERAENLVDEYEDKLGTYLVKITGRELSEEQNREASKYLHTLSDLERISDHAMNTAEVAREISEKKIRFSGAALGEIKVLTAAVTEILTMSVRAFEDNDVELAYRVEPLEERIDVLCDEMKIHHVDRLQTGDCSLAQGFVFNDLLTNFERVADHCSNLAVAMIELNSSSYDTHGYIIDLKEFHAHHFNEFYDEYSEKYKI